MKFINSFRSEWLKTRRSAAAWLTLIGGFLIPLVILIARIMDFDALYEIHISQRFWEIIYNQCWHYMAIFLLPMGVILATSLITQLEFKNNTWKQLHTTPQNYTTIFIAKFAVIIVMMLQYFVLFNIGIYLAGVIPSIVYKGIPYPEESLPYLKIIKVNAIFFIDCLPIIALQYLISMQFKNFMAPVGFGLGMFILSIMTNSWKYTYLVPYIYCTLNALGKNSPVSPNINIHLYATIYFMFFMTTSYFLYITKKEKG